MLPRSNRANGNLLSPGSRMPAAGASSGPWWSFSTMRRMLRLDGIGNGTSDDPRIDWSFEVPEASLLSSPQPAPASAATASATAIMTERGLRITVFTVSDKEAGNAACPRRPDMVPGVRLPLQTRAEMLAVLARRGMVRPIRPDRLARAGLALHRWGPTPAGSFTVNSITRGDQFALIDDDEAVTYKDVEARTNAIA